MSQALKPSSIISSGLTCLRPFSLDGHSSPTCSWGGFKAPQAYHALSDRIGPDPALRQPGSLAGLGLCVVDSTAQSPLTIDGDLIRQPERPGCQREQHPTVPSVHLSSCNFMAPCGGITLIMLTSKCGGADKLLPALLACYPDVQCTCSERGQRGRAHSGVRYHQNIFASLSHARKKKSAKIWFTPSVKCPYVNGTERSDQMYPDLFQTDLLSASGIISFRSRNAFLRNGAWMSN